MSSLTIFDNFDNFDNVWQCLTFFDNVWHFWQFFDNFDNFNICLQFWQFWQFLTIGDNLHNSDNCFYHFDNWKDNPGNLLHLRHWLHFWQLRTWIHDNRCYLTIKSDTGQHSQFLRCFSHYQMSLLSLMIPRYEQIRWIACCYFSVQDIQWYRAWRFSFELHVDWPFKQVSSFWTLI